MRYDVVSSFTNRREAEELTDKLANDGYASALVVEEDILKSDKLAISIALDELEAYVNTVGDEDEAHDRQLWAIRKLRALLTGQSS